MDKIAGKQMGKTRSHSQGTFWYFLSDQEHSNFSDINQITEGQEKISAKFILLVTNGSQNTTF